MRKLAFVVAAASLFAFGPVASRLGPIASSLGLVWMSVMLAIFVSGRVQPLAVAGGALGAFMSGVLAPLSPAAAGALLVAATFGERTTRVRSRNGRAIHVLLAFVGGALAGTLSVAFTTSAIPIFIVSVVVASVLASLPFLVDADDPVAHALEEASKDVSEPAKKSLLDGAELRRSAIDVPLDTQTQARVRKTWQSLLKLAEARTRLERTRPQVLVRIAEGDEPKVEPTAADAVRAMVDKRIEDHVEVLSRAIAAVDTAHAAAVGLDDAALKNVESIGDSLEEASRAMVEVRDDPWKSPTGDDEVPAAKAAT